MTNEQKSSNDPRPIGDLLGDISNLIGDLGDREREAEIRRHDLIGDTEDVVKRREELDEEDAAGRTNEQDSDTAHRSLRIAQVEATSQRIEMDRQAEGDQTHQ